MKFQIQKDIWLTRRYSKFWILDLRTLTEQLYTITHVSVYQNLLASAKTQKQLPARIGKKVIKIPIALSKAKVQTEKGAST